MDLHVFGGLTIAVSFIDAKNHLIFEQYILDPEEVCKLIELYNEDAEDTDISLKQWIFEQLGGVVTIENVHNFLVEHGLSGHFDIVDYDS